MNREQKIIRTSIIGIAANVFLAAFKAAAGLLSHSVAIVLDAVNNLSDALSSLITIIGTKLAGKQPDKKHPLGYGRIEYISATVISLIVLYAGITALVESVKKILHPELPEYSAVPLIIVGAAVAVKILLGLYVQKKGKETDSDALTASGKDAMFDSIISASTLAAAAIYLFTGKSLEAYLGAVIALVIIKSGIEMLRDTMSEILGERTDPALSRAVKQTVTSFPEVKGAYDLLIHAYGPDTMVGSVHISVPDTMTVKELDTLERKITRKVVEENHVFLTGISVYSSNTEDQKIAVMERDILRLLDAYPEIRQMHGFYVNEESGLMKFDIIISYDVEDRAAVCASVREQIEEIYPGYTIEITPDTDFSD